MDDESLMPLVVDAGSSRFRAGLAGNDVASCIIPSVIGSSRFSKDKVDGLVGHHLENEVDLMSLHYPIQRGIVTNWDDMETLLSYSYQQINIDPKEHPVLFADPPLNPRANQESLAQLMFEKFESPAIALSSSAYLCLYCCGRNCGVMVNIGDGISFAVPFYESYCLRNGIHRQEFAGRDVTSYLQKSLLEKGHSFTTTSEFETVRDMKEKLCYTAYDYDADMIRSNKTQDLESSYTLCDGTDISINSERFQCMEALFQPSKFGFQGFLSIQEMIYDSIQSCEIDTKANIYINIILSGSTALNRGFKERLKKEMDLLLPPTLRNNVICYPESSYSVWIGGSILGSLSSFTPSLISKQMYEEYGPSVIHRCR